MSWGASQAPSQRASLRAQPRVCTHACARPCACTLTCARPCTRTRALHSYAEAPGAASQQPPRACLKRWIRQRKWRNHQRAQAPNDCLFTFFFFFNFCKAAPPSPPPSSSFLPCSALLNRSPGAAEPGTGGEQKVQKMSVATAKSDAGGLESAKPATGRDICSCCHSDRSGRLLEGEPEEGRRPMCPPIRLLPPSRSPCSTAPASMEVWAWGCGGKGKGGWQWGKNCQLNSLSALRDTGSILQAANTQNFTCDSSPRASLLASVSTIMGTKAQAAYHHPHPPNYELRRYLHSLTIDAPRGSRQDLQERGWRSPL